MTNVTHTNTAKSMLRLIPIGLVAKVAAKDITFVFNDRSQSPQLTSLVFRGNVTTFQQKIQLDRKPRCFQYVLPSVMATTTRDAKLTAITPASAQRQPAVV